MKKFLSIFLTVMLTFAMVTVIAFATDVPEVPSSQTGIFTDANGIKCTNLLDFNKTTNALWAEQNPDTGKWECFLDYGNWEQPMDENEELPIAPILKPYSSFSAHTWELIEDGEVFHFESTDSSIYPGVSFLIDDNWDGVMEVGRESDSKPKAEFVKIRIRNHSVCDQITFGFVEKQTNNGKFVSAAVSELTKDANGKEYKSSGEWETYTFSMHTINMNTNYSELIYDPTDPEDTPKSRWGGPLYEFMIFPFGYDVSDGSGNYPGASMDIDYVVIGSRDYVDNYQSALEIKENSIESLTIDKVPTKKDYYVGEVLDLEGLELTATYNDGTPAETLYTASANVSTFIEVTDKVTLKFGSKSVEFPVNVVDIEKIEFIKAPEKTEYKADDLEENGFDSTGYQLKVTYTDGTTKTSDVSPSAENGAELANASFKFTVNAGENGAGTLIAYYFGKAATYDVTLLQITGIEATLKDGVNYRYDSTPDVEKDFDINFIYSDNSKVAAADVSATFEYTLDCQVKNPGETTATIKAATADGSMSFETTTTVTIEAPVSVEIVTDDTFKTEYERNEAFSRTGLTVNLVYANGDKVAVADEDFTTDVRTATSGKKTVPVRTSIEGLSDLFKNLKLEITVAGGGNTSSNTTTSTTNNNNQGGSSSNNNGWVLPVIIVAAVLVVGAVVVVVLVVVKKKKN